MKQFARNTFFLITASCFVVLLACIFFFWRLKAQPEFRLSSSEIKWLNEHKEIYFSGDPAYFPFDFADAKGMHKGLAQDYLSVIENRLGIKFIYKKADTWQEVIPMLESGEIDLISNIGMNDERIKKMDFSESYLELPFYIVTNKNNKQFRTLSELKNEIFVMPKDYNVTLLLKKEHPKLEIIELENDRESLQKINIGEADATICDLASVSYYVQNDGLGNLSIAEEVNFTYYGRFAVQKDNRVLLDLINKVLYSIPKSQKEDIYEKWVNLKFDKYKLYKKVILIAIIVIFCITGALFFYVFWNETLRKQVELRTQELTEITENLDFLVEEKTTKLNETINLLESSLKENHLLFSVMSHDLKNSFSSLMGISEMMVNDPECFTPEEQKTFFDAIHKSSSDTYNLMLNFLNWSRSKYKQLQIEISDCNMTEMLFNTIDQLQIHSKVKGISFITNLESINVQSDFRRLEIVFRNIIQNCIKYSSKESTIYIRTYFSGKDVVVQITDYGIGMSKELIDSILEGKNQNSSQGSVGEVGNGIGMLIVKQFTDDLNIKLEIQSEMGKETSFILHFPSNDITRIKF